MKHNFKKILSMLLTVCMLLGTMAAMFPMTVGAADAEPIYLKKNETATINGITYRFDTNETNNPDSWARLNPDGTWEISYRYGDTLWFPDVELTAESTIHFELTNTSTGYMDKNIAGVAYGISANADGSYNDLMVAANLNNGRFRIARVSATENNVNNSNGSGGNPSHELWQFFDTDEPSTWGNHAIWNDVAPINKCVAAGKSITFDVEKLENGDVSVAYGAQGHTFITKAYNQNTEFNNDTDRTRPYEGGAVGYSSTYTYEPAATQGYTQVRIDAFDITNCKVDGQNVDSYSVLPAITNTNVSLSLDGTIGLNFSFNVTSSLPTGATVVATKNGEVVATKDVVVGTNVVTAAVNAKEMTDGVNFAIMVDGAAYNNNSYTVSVAEYADKLMANDDYNDWDELISAMLNYGAAAQKLLNYKADEADVSGIEDYDFSDFAAVKFNGEKGILKGLHMNLSLESDTVLNLYFMPVDGTKPTVTVEGSSDVELVDNGDGYWVLSISNIAADELSSHFEITVNGQLSFSVNALDWARIASESAETETLANALAAYADAAERKN